MFARTTAPSASQDREVLRLAAPVVLWWIWLAFVAVNVVGYTVQGLPSARFGAVVSAVLLSVTGLTYTLALRPRVIADSAGLTVVNPFRTHHVAWRAITSVDTREWVRVHYAAPDGADTRMLLCWALYVSARARRRIAHGTPRPRRASRATEAAEAVGGYASANSGSRLPEEARHLASLPVAKAMASRLDARAAKERARRPRQSQPTDQPPSQAPDQPTATWDWPALAAAVIPAVVLLIVALV